MQLHSPWCQSCPGKTQSLGRAVAAVQHLHSALCAHAGTVLCLHVSPRLTHYNEAPVSSRISSQLWQEGGSTAAAPNDSVHTQREMPPQQNQRSATHLRKTTSPTRVTSEKNLLRACECVSALHYSFHKGRALRSGSKCNFIVYTLNKFPHKYREREAGGVFCCSQTQSEQS